jgi:peptidoglycan/LPS O-acetylase OafA/YrhL
VLLLVASVRWNAFLQNVLGKRGAAISRRIGLTTYPLYLLHGNIGEWLVEGLYRHIGYVASIGLVLGVVVVAAAVIAIKVEPWVRERLSLIGHVLSRTDAATA